MNSKRQIIKAMAVIRRPRDGALLVSESPEPLFQRPLGGHVEFGEYAVDTIHREFVEEIGQVVTDVRLLGVLENIFGWRGGTEHEVVFIFAAAFLDEAAYEIEEQLIRDDTEPKNRVVWRAADAVSPPLYPAGLSELIASSLELARVRMTAAARSSTEAARRRGESDWAHDVCPPSISGHSRTAAARRSIRVRAGKARIPQTRVGRPPMTSDQRAPTV